MSAKRSAAEEGAGSVKRVAPSSCDTTSRPHDWPQGSVPISLAVQDLPHSSAAAEWWYLHAHIETLSRQRYAIVAAFFTAKADFTNAKGSDDARPVVALVWSITCLESGQRKAFSFLPANAPAVVDALLVREQRDNDSSSKDELAVHFRTALLELAREGRIPRPDRLMSSVSTLTGSAEANTLSLVFDDHHSLRKDSSGVYSLHCACDDICIDVQMTPSKSPFKHGHDGVTMVSLSDDPMYYYSISNLSVSGTVSFAQRDQPLTISRGLGWYDHEFGCGSATGVTKKTWYWLSVHLNNEEGENENNELVAVQILGSDARHIDAYCNFISPDGSSAYFDVLQLRELPQGKYWTSGCTMTRYPLSWRLSVPQLALEATIELLPAHEFITLVASRGNQSFYESPITVRGMLNGKAITGTGFMEIQGYAADTTFLGRCSDAVLRSLDDVLPHNIQARDVRELIGGDLFPHWSEGVPPSFYHEVIVRPIREMIDRRGKAWRSWIFLACIGAVGGEPETLLGTLFMPELLHTGSLIIDDVEDNSNTRRGAPSCHVMFGLPTAINAGNAAYFLSELFTNRIPNLPLATRVAIYEQYFVALRAAHAGQGLDIRGLTDLVPAAVESGDVAALLNAILAIHRLKSGAPVAALARIACLIGSATEEQATAMARFWEALGVAFQIKDDVLNLTGFSKADWKVKGEDLIEGKVTVPVVIGLKRSADRAARDEIWRGLQLKSRDAQVIAHLTNLLVDCGAIAECHQLADAIVDKAWQALTPLIPDSYQKLMIRAFARCILTRVS